MSKQSQFEINLKEKDDPENPFGAFNGNSHVIYTPNYFFNTPALQFQSPNNINLSATSQGNILMRPFV